jgi:8-amino-7-oxononanoate synthase
VDAFDDAIRKWRKAGGTGHPWIAVESLYSMDGDRAPLIELAELSDRHDGFLLVDEAHATGVYGADGRGLSADLEGRDNIVVLHTCGKALGTAGALVTGSRLLCDFLVNRARSFIYATAPLSTSGGKRAPGAEDRGGRTGAAEKLLQLIAFANEQLSCRLGIEGSGSQILPVIIGDNGRTVRMAERMQAKGFDIRAIRPPTVPDGTARLRIAITLNVDPPTIARMFDRLAQVMAEETP